jgi:DNA-binding response OmpR family regulator
MPPYGATSTGRVGDKLLIVDDDVCFGALISAVAKDRGFIPRFFTSLIDMGSFARIKEFDVAIIDYYLGSLRGDEIAEYVDTFFSEVPVIIVSSEDLRETRSVKWPASVRTFIPKTEGPARIIETARQIVKRERLLKRFARVPGTSEAGLR